MLIRSVTGFVLSFRLASKAVSNKHNIYQVENCSITRCKSSATQFIPANCDGVRPVIQFAGIELWLMEIMYDIQQRAISR